MKRSRIKPKVSDFEREFQAMKPYVYERAEMGCEAETFAREYTKRIPTIDARLSVLPLCGGRATNVHHRKYRSRRGSNRIENLIALCGPCHAWIHAHPEESNRLGLSLHAGESEELSAI